MKKIYSFLLILSSFFTAGSANGQCTNAELNWDFLDFLPSTGSAYTSWYTSSTVPYTQYFAMGTRRVTFTMGTTSNFTLNGENATNTAHAGSFATAGDDVQFTTSTTSDRTITMALDSNVTNMTFSMFDIDNSQRVTITATNLLGVSQTVLITHANLLSGITLGGTLLAPTATGPAAGYANNDNYGTINVSIIGPVANVVITLNNASGDVWLSDIDACVTGSFVNNWRNISRPFTGMPSYILTVRNNVFYQLDPATGRADSLFADPAHTNMNAMSYDPVNRYVYYGYSLTATPSTTRTIYRYSLDTDTKSTFITDVNAGPAAIPTYEPGVTSGSASFYNGAMYLGIESSNGSRNSGRENTVWRIDLDVSQNPTRATQIYAARSDSNISGSNRLIHDWSDIGISNNGILYDFDGAANDSMYYHFNMMTGQRVQFTPTGAGNIGPKQLGIDWQENVYNMGGLPSGSPSTIGGYVVPYNYNGTVNNAENYLVYTMPGPIYPTGSWGDCGEAFRPYCDFGDAPASYDPDQWSPAVHERDSAIRIGATFDREWIKTSSAMANADGSDEDGLSFVPIFSPGYGNYLAQVSVYNNTGETATLIAWLDFNGNGLFDTGEACQAQAPVSSTPAIQSRWLYWPSAPTTLPNGSFTYLRIRLVRTSSGMTNSNPTGYYNNGETEDYRIIVDNFPLNVNLLNFNAAKAGTNKVKLNWSADEDGKLSAYEVQRSANGGDWHHLNYVNAGTTSGTRTYDLLDNQPFKGINYYRLVFNTGNGQVKYSEVRTVRFDELLEFVTIAPNPAIDRFQLRLTNDRSNSLIQIKLMGMDGRVLYEQKNIANPGENIYNVVVKPDWAKGMYLVHITRGEESTVKKLIIN